MSQTPSEEQQELQSELLLLQGELQTVKQIHSSIRMLNHMTASLQKTLESVAKNSNDLKDCVNEVSKTAFTQST